VHVLDPIEPVWSRLKRSLANLTKHDIAELTALVKTRLKRMQYRPELLAGFLASTRLLHVRLVDQLARDRGEPFVEVTLLGHRAPLPCASEANHGIQRLGVLLVIAASGRTRPGRRRAPRSAVAVRGALRVCCVGQAMERTLDRSAPVWLLAAASVSTMARSTSPPCSLISREVSAAR
jgi:hypothetical protein